MAVIARFIAWLMAALPERASRCLGRGLGRLFYGFAGRRREQTREALRFSFPDWPESRVRETTKKVFINQGLFFVEFFRKVGRPRKNPLDAMVIAPDDLHRFHETLRVYKSAIFLVGHINNYEYLSAWAAQHYPVTIIAKPIKPPGLGAFIKKARADAGLQEFPHRGSYRQVVRNLKAGGCVGFILDQNISRDRGVFVTFFERPACTSPGLAMMSAHAQAPVVPAYTLREGDVLRIRFHEPIPPPPDRERNTLQDFTQRYTRELENMIRTQPESWIWMHRRWKTNPLPGDRITRTDGTDYFYAAH